MIFPLAPRRSGHGGAFTLVEVTIAIGIVAFSLVAILGVMPLALGSERLSFNEGRASAVANTLFATFRSQPFQNVLYLDSQYSPTGAPNSSEGLNLATQSTASPQTPITLYATFLSVASDTATSKGVVPDDPLGNSRRLCFTANPPSGGADYQIALYFSAVPGIVAVGSQQQAIQIETVVTPVNRPQSQFHFASTVTSRSN